MSATHLRFEEEEEEGTQQAPPTRTDDAAPALQLRPHTTAFAGSGYVLELAAPPGRETLAAAISDGTCRLYAVSGAALDLAGECTGHKGAVTSLAVHPDSPDLLLSGSVDGTVRGWDMRSGQQIEQYAAPQGMSISSLAAAGDHIAAGAEGCVCFWDRRSGQELACFDDTHPEAVTQVLFHPQQPHMLLSGSMDGLLNVADLSGGLDEDGSFKAALNLDASVARMGLYGEAGEALWVLSHTESLHLWEWQAACDEEAAGGEGSLADVLDVRERLSLVHAGPSGQELPALDYLVGCSYQQGRLMLAAGWESGRLSLHEVRTPPAGSPAGGCSFSPCRMLLGGGHTEDVRTMLWPTDSCPVFVTGGEDGRICTWSAVGDADPAPLSKRGAAGTHSGSALPQKKRRKQLAAAL